MAVIVFRNYKLYSSLVDIHVFFIYNGIMKVGMNDMIRTTNEGGDIQCSIIL